ncbi:MAG: type VI secretion system-associated protein TagF [Gammaproteobacteria bacterium]|nr:type VI secretion system-associated protein TagF [Gammaproteobacteria bacterium]
MSAGYFGKLPMRGDFIQRNMPVEFVHTWDNWLQSVIATSHHNLAHSWLEHYLVSPVWRYLVPQQSQSYQMGVMLPSVDKVGRYFPFTISTNVFPKADAPRLISKNRDWFNTAENIALQALNESIDYEQLNAIVDELEVQNYPAELNPGRRISFRIPVDNMTSLENALEESRQHLPAKPEFNISYWWNEGNQDVPGNLICCEGMPDDNIYTAMLDGQWSLCHIENKDSTQFMGLT